MESFIYVNKKEGYDNVSEISINVSQEELKKRLHSANIPEEKIKKYVR